MKDFEPKHGQTPTNIENAQVRPTNRTYLTPEQDQARFAELFPVDIQAQLKNIGGFLTNIVEGYRESEWSGYSHPVYKYSQEQIEQQQWEEADLQAAIEHVRKHEVARPYFRDASQEFSNLHARRESVVRLDQEQAIVDDLERGKPVLIRGNWRIGKSSMALRMVDRMGTDRSIYFDVGSYAGLEKEGEEKFRAKFGLRNIADFVADKELQGQEVDYSVKWKHRDEVQERIGASGYNPFAYLNEWLGQRGESTYIGLDEVIYYADKPEAMQHIADLKDHKNLRVAIVLHHIAQYEEAMRQIFTGYNSHYIRRITSVEARTMIEHGIQGTEIQFTDDAVEELMAFSGGRPMEINYVLTALLEPYSDDFSPKLVYRVEDIKGITERETWRLPEMYRRVAIYTYERIYRLAMTDEQRVIIDSLIAKRSKRYKVGSVDSATLQPLLDTNVLIEDPATKEHRLNGQLFVRAIQEMKAHEAAEKRKKRR